MSARKTGAGQQDVVTGAFGYSGAAIARELMAVGHRVRTLTNHSAGSGSPIEARPLDFTDQAGLVDALRGATTLYNTYWVRFARGAVDHAVAVTNSRRLFEAASQANVQRIVHVSITHPNLSSPYPYFRGKAAVEQALGDGGIPHTILRPSVLFGGDGVLLNNIAWLLRRFPVFAIGGSGQYRVRPIHVDDLAQLAVTAGRAQGNQVLDAVGPDRPTFIELVRAIRTSVRSHSLLVRVPGPAIPLFATALGLVLRDRLLTSDEYRAMADGLADTDGPPTGVTSALEWIAGNGATLGRTYANELDRHFRSRSDARTTARRHEPPS
jgi:NADH dehydrogenase